MDDNVRKIGYSTSHSEIALDIAMTTDPQGARSAGFSTIPSPDELVWRRERAEAISQAWLRLSPIEERVLTLLFFEEKTESEVARLYKAEPAEIAEVKSRAIGLLREFVSYQFQPRLTAAAAA